MTRAPSSFGRFALRYTPFVAVAVALALVATLVPSTAGNGSSAGAISTALGNAPALPPVSAACSRGLTITSITQCRPQWRTGENNGGATWGGVTKNSINIVAYNAPDNQLVASLLGGEGPGKLLGTPAEEANTLKVYAKWFNENFQTYGRHVNIIPYNSAGTLSDESTSSRADAVAIEKQDHAFLTIGGELDESFFTQLTKERIISIAGAQLPESFYKANAPYIFGMLPTTDDENSFIAAFVCHQLGPHSVASFGGANSTPPVNGRPRTYGIIYPTTNSDGTPSMYAGVGQQMAADLAKCGIHVNPQDEVGYSLDPTTALSQVQAGSTRLIQDRITTVICLCDPVSPIFTSGGEASQNYYPEEVETGYLLQDYYQLDQLYNQAEWSHVFGISSLPVSGDPQDSLYYEAYKSIDPNGAPNPDDELIFYELLLAFAGIEGAGPHLTAETFAQSMFHRVRINSTGPSFPTFYYTPDDYGGIKDAQMVWWDPTAPSPDGKDGNFESVDGGYRFTVKDWPDIKATTLFGKMACIQLGSCGLPTYPTAGSSGSSTTSTTSSSVPAAGTTSSRGS